MPLLLRGWLHVHILINSSPPLSLPNTQTPTHSATQGINQALIMQKVDIQLGGYHSPRLTGDAHFIHSKLIAPICLHPGGRVFPMDSVQYVYRNVRIGPSDFHNRIQGSTF